MQTRFRVLPAPLLALGLGGCELVGDVFEAGFWVGVIVVVVILVIVGWAVYQLFD